MLGLHDDKITSYFNSEAHNCPKFLFIFIFGIKSLSDYFKLILGAIKSVFFNLFTRNNITSPFFISDRIKIIIVITSF